MVHTQRGKSNTRALDAKLIYLLAQKSSADRPLAIKEIRRILLKLYGDAPQENTIYHHLTHLAGLAEDLSGRGIIDPSHPYLVRRSGRAYGKRQSDDPESYGWYIEPVLSRAEVALILAGMESAGVSGEAWEGIVERIFAMGAEHGETSAVARRERIASESWAAFLETLDALVDAMEKKVPLRLRDRAYASSREDAGRRIASGCWAIPLRVAFLGNGILYLIGAVIDERGDVLAGDGRGIHAFRVDHIELLDTSAEIQQKLAPIARRTHTRYGEGELTALLGTKAQPDYDDYDMDDVLRVEFRTRHPELLEAFYGESALTRRADEDGWAAIEVLTTRDSAIGWMLQYGLDDETDVISPQELRDDLASIGERLTARFGSAPTGSRDAP